MITIEQAAQRVNDRAKEKEVFIDPATIMLICAILSAVFSAIRLWCEWRRNKKVEGKDIREACVTKPLWVKRRIHRVVYKELGHQKYYELGGDNIVDSILEAGAYSTPEELQQLYDENENKVYRNRFGELEKEV